MSAELVLEAHRRHLNNSNDRDARDAFLREAINFFAKTPESECILHHPETPDIHVELLGYFSPKNFIEEPVKSILNKLGRQLSTCFDCLHYYYQAKLQFRSRWGSQFTPETLRQLFDRIHNWDLERQHATLSSFQTQYDLKSDTITAPEFRKLRKKIFCVLEEIFRFPGERCE
ncbi:uncharacterized protein EV422DRAFT_19308 [Fimicolochytrium jonesii]|uniref:uncharacterized protein n=1 Tax=Fimicolochytrium jonesii TaxID=1396493 RepID=UPI0022FE6A1F|nr:uncharacterized protein EV422DRAFT_19308 [Fimicolochytrium jonesii]KAI8826957.1 hypothetical protein EV422DRAFT_19308 [Fimicolochytrium jonesii]